MSDSGLSSAFEEVDLYLSSLNFVQFRQEIETNGRVLRSFSVEALIGLKPFHVDVWDVANGAVINEQMTLEAIINNAILTQNALRRARRRRSASPVRENGAFILMAKVINSGNIEEQLSIEYKPAPDFVYRHR